MRDPARINEILSIIEKVWKKNPDLRLMQLLGNCWTSGHDPYYIEDDELLKKIQQSYIKEKDEE